MKRVPLASQDPEPKSQEHDQVSARASKTEVSRDVIQKAELGLMGHVNLHGRGRESSDGKWRKSNKDYMIYLEKQRKILSNPHRPLPSLFTWYL